MRTSLVKSISSPATDDGFLKTFPTTDRFFRPGLPLPPTAMHDLPPSMIWLSLNARLFDTCVPSATTTTEEFPALPHPTTSLSDSRMSTDARVANVLSTPVMIPVDAVLLTLFPTTWHCLAPKTTIPRATVTPLTTLPLMMMSLQKSESESAPTTAIASSCVART